ncbi:flippase-like domain-containing protein [candidate division KSB1 bacterium]|nr:flippase-like domain-containing protein [candidate division KSB1 bacterium]
MSKKKIILLCLKIFLAVLVLAALVHKISADKIFSALHEARWAYIGVAFLLVFINFFIQYKKWYLLVVLEKPEVSTKEVMSSLLAGITLGFVTPGRVGEFGRSFFIKKSRWTILLGLTLIDKVLVSLTIYFFGTFGLLFFSTILFDSHQTILLGLITALFFIMCIYLLFHPRVLRNLLQKINIKVKKYPKIQQFLTGLAVIDRKTIYQLLSLNVLYYFVFITQFYLLVLTFFRISLLNGFLALFSTMFVKTLLPITIADLGIRETAAVFFLGQLNVPQEAAFNASFFLFIINILLPSIIGLFILLKSPVIWKTKKNDAFFL